jgi:hypothetical protein
MCGLLRGKTMGIVLVEPIIIQDIFLTGVFPELLRDGSIRFNGYSEHNSFRIDGVEYVVQTKTVMSVQTALAAIQETMKLLGFACCGGERMQLRH